MTLDALQHLLRSAITLTDGRRILVLGSASLLASFPDLGEPQHPLASTYDADLLPEPFDELCATMLDEALGENRAYNQIHGYHADILRDSALTTLPPAWNQRLIPVPAVNGAFALNPHDLAAVKLLVGRPKDLALLRTLHAHKLFDPSTVRECIDSYILPVESLPRLHSNFQSIFNCP